ncbi:MAG: FecR domain-containing protein [Bacteroidota bacterium]
MTHQIIVNHLRQNETAEEQQILENWLKESPKNQLLLDEFKTVWMNSSSSDQKHDFNNARAWSRIEKSITPHKGELRYLWEYKWFKVAASIVLILGVALLANQYSEKGNIAEHEEQIELNADVETRIFQLPDGSEVTLMPGATLAYNAAFIDNRRVSLVGGAHFDVVSKNAEFTVESNKTTITVLGTQFFINEVIEGTIVYVEEGRVAVNNAAVEDIMTLNQDEAIRINEDKGTVEVIEQTSNLTAWKTGVLSFEDSRLSDVINDINEYYGVDLRFKNSSLGDCHITSKFDNKTLDEVIEVIQIVLSVEITQTDTKEYSISGKGC